MDETPAAESELESFDVRTLGETAYVPPVAKERRAFEPWHRPRKQFVRRHQWLAEVWKALEERPEGDRLKYLGLPGTDLLDLRLLHAEVCLPQGRELAFLGFHNGAHKGTTESINLDISVQELKQLANVAPQSEVLRDDIRRLAGSKSMVTKRTWETGPFDVVNLDLCDSVAADDPMRIESLYTALNRLAALQARRKSPWLLLLTTRFDRASVSGEAAESLLVLFKHALDCPEVRGVLAPCMADLVLEDDPASISVDSLSDHDFILVMTLGFCMWFFERVQATGPQRTNLRAVFCYEAVPLSTESDMLSLALRFSPELGAPADPAGLASGDDPIDWCAAAQQLSVRLSQKTDVDEALRAEEGLRDDLINESVALLAQARYDSEAYREWVAAYPS